MSIVSEHIIPNKEGEIFETNAKSLEDLKKIKKHLLTLEGVSEVQLNATIFPTEITIHTSEFVKKKDVEHKVIQAGFHAISKNLFDI